MMDNLLLTDAEIQAAWPDDLVTKTPILTRDDIEQELVRCAREIAKAQLDKAETLIRQDERERVIKELGLFENDLGFCEISNHVPYSSLKQ